ncbi:hypothetical protein R6V09_13875 [Streptomyces sp. W16]|uniref:hypothetical protein n=1 Tax=Streptomyces sp. W16 TaxID=3076631 RepID=UPI00295B2B73|nr:hypothetical protein [Streptomyces sp. W16]MDV9171210.1 hypothetical protein [Streptomyces sp. W16]
MGSPEVTRVISAAGAEVLSAVGVRFEAETERPVFIVVDDLARLDRASSAVLGDGRYEQAIEGCTTALSLDIAQVPLHGHRRDAAGTATVRHRPALSNGN